jgi:hypothetical protein
MPAIPYGMHAGLAFVMTDRRKRAGTEAVYAACARRCMAVVVGMYAESPHS